MSLKTGILKIKGDWTEVASDCRTTVGKPPLDHEPSVDFKKKILIAEHSPIRDISVKWTWRGIKSWVATHWSRHKFEKYIKSQRSDRTGIPRDKLPQDAPVDFTGEANVQSLIVTPCASACAASPRRRRGSMPRTLRRRCMRSSRKLRMCFARAAYIAGGVRKCIRAGRTRTTLMC